MVVFIIIGILTAVAIPHFIGQIGKAREVEFAHSLGTIMRAQQAYHWEHSTFAQGADDQETLNFLGLTIDNKYIDTYNILGNNSQATITPINNEYEEDGTRAYSAGIFYNAPSYANVLCRSFQIQDQILPPLGAGDCQGNEVIR